MMVMKDRIDRIMALDLTDSQRKMALNHARMDVMRKHSFYSKERESLDNYIREALRALKGTENGS